MVVFAPPGSRPKPLRRHEEETPIAGPLALLNSRRKPILAALPESRQAKAREAKEHHPPGRQFGDGLGAAHRRGGRRRRGWTLGIGKRQETQVTNDMALALIGRHSDDRPAGRIHGGVSVRHAQRK